MTLKQLVQKHTDESLLFDERVKQAWDNGAQTDKNNTVMIERKEKAFIERA